MRNIQCPGSLVIIMSKSRQHHVIPCEFMGENVLGRVFLGNVASGSPKYRVFGGLGARCEKVVEKRSAQDCSESSICTEVFEHS